MKPKSELAFWRKTLFLRAVPEFPTQRGSILNSAQNPDDLKYNPSLLIYWSLLDKYPCKS